MIVGLKPKCIALVTLDSLRWDVVQDTRVPNIDRFLMETKADPDYARWHRTFAHGTFTLPSHVAMFHAGWMPDRAGCGIPLLDGKVQRFFRLLPIGRMLQGEEPLVNPAYSQGLNPPNLMQLFADYGYRTVGIGGVGWFNTKTKTGQLWQREYFQEFYWKPEFHEQQAESLFAQVEAGVDILDDHAETAPEQPLFLFLNVAATHWPYVTGNGDYSWDAQADALRHVDSLLPELLGRLPRPALLILTSDHGDCMGEDGLEGHGFYHPKVMEVPLAWSYLE